MKRNLLGILFFFIPFIMTAQAIQPSLMVMPSKQWCHDHGFEQTITKDNGQPVKIYDYERALIEYRELGPAIRKVGELMQERGFRLKDFQQTLEISANESALDAVRDDVDDDDPETKILAAAGTDLNLRINWFIQPVQPGNRQQLTYELTAFDSFSGKQVANVGNTTLPLPSTLTEIDMLQGAVIGGMDTFMAQLVSYFREMKEKGREIRLRIQVATGWEDGLETEVGDEELTDIIEDWVSDNTVSHRYHLETTTAKQMVFDSCYIPLYDAEGQPIDARKWANGLRRFLRKQEKKVPSKMLPGRNLGSARIMIGVVED